MRHFALFLCLLACCADEDEAGRGNCRGDKSATLSSWCRGRPECEQPLLERWNSVCKKMDCTTECYDSFRNACGGYTIERILGTDAYSERYHYNASGALVGVTVQPFSIPCTIVTDVYGMDCASQSGDLACPAADAG